MELVQLFLAQLIPSLHGSDLREESSLTRSSNTSSANSKLSGLGFRTLKFLEGLLFVMNQRYM